jgi:hypothetical protein
MAACRTTIRRAICQPVAPADDDHSAPNRIAFDQPKIMAEKLAAEK